MFDHEYDASDARRVIDLYGAELAAMARAAIEQYPSLDPPGAVICEPGTSEGDSLRSQLDPNLPVRVVEDGVALLVMGLDDLRRATAQLEPSIVSFLDDEDFTGPGRLPILAVCKQGFLMGSVAR